jgi:hypothetical protein
MVRTLEVHVVSHYRAERTRELAVVLDAMLAWRDCALHVIITSNVGSYESDGFLAPYVDAFARGGHRLTLNVVDDLDDPFMLAWEHKRFLEPWLRTAAPDGDYFMWIEDDIRITDDNLDFFLRELTVLKPHGLIPGFLRYETKGDELRLVDIMEPEYVDQRTIVVDGRPFHACINPYWAGSILDRELAVEYLASRSFDPVSSEFVPWAIRERAAMGLTWEHPRSELGTRVVIPLVHGKPAESCLVWHVSNKYSTENHPLIAALTIARAFRPRTPLVRRFKNLAKRILRRS